ncbi:MAG: hypothetical protein V5A37_05370 [Halobacteriales archaeon]
MSRVARPDDGPIGRGQLVLVAAGVVAVALVPILGAYLQLGYAADVDARADYTAPAQDAEGTLSRAVDDVSQGIPGAFAWPRGEAAASAVRSRLSPALSSLRTARLRAGTASRVEYNDTRARRWAGEQCPGGPARQFGGCAAFGGVVVQNRTGRTHVVAVALDLTVVGERRTVEKTLVVRPIRGIG